MPLVEVTALFFLSINATSCLPQNKDIENLRSTAAICQINPESCDLSQPMAYLADASGSVSILTLAQGFAPRTAVPPVERPATDDHLISLGDPAAPETLLFRPVKQTSANGGLFLRDVIDTDRLLVTTIKTMTSGTTVLKTKSVTLNAGDVLLVRAAVTLEVAREDTANCAGLTASAQLRIAEGSAPLSGQSVTFDALSVRKTATISGLVRVAGPGKYAFEMQVVGNRPSCTATILEPSTLTVTAFTPLTKLDGYKASARFLLVSPRAAVPDIAPGQPGSIPAVRIPSAPSGPPIITLARLEWNHAQDDLVLIEASAQTTAEDRMAETTSWLQVTRAPTGLNSHLHAMSLTPGNGAVRQIVFDWAAAPPANGHTTFYLNIMGTNENSKPLAITASKIAMLHFRRAARTLTPGNPGPPETPEAVESINSAATTTSKSARLTDLFALRALMQHGQTPPPEDFLMCALFKPGLLPVSGLPVAIPTPVHHHFRTRWDDSRINFPVVIFENIYHQNPAWAFTPPADRISHYTERFYEVTVINPESAACRYSAVRR